MKNVVFIPNIDLGNNRSNPYHYSIKSWKKWCDKNNIILFEWKNAILDTKKFPITFQRYLVFDILDQHKIKYNQILMVDADTIIHPNCPNFFNETQNKFGVTINNGCYEWVTRSINSWGDSLFPNELKPKTWEYFNGGFQIVNESHKEFFDEVLDFYFKNQDVLREKQKSGLGTDQTPINYLIQTRGIDLKLFPSTYNLHHMVSKNLLNFGQSWWGDSLENLYEQAWVYHFNAIPTNEMKRDSSYFIERAYKELYK